MHLFSGGILRIWNVETEV